MSTKGFKLPVEYITEDGWVKYAALMKDTAAMEMLNHNVQYVATANLEGKSREERMAFFCNAYNMVCLRATVEQMKKKPTYTNEKWYNKVSFFFMAKHTICGKKMTLYALENKIIRPEFEDPRLHMYLNCASYSCPRLPRRLMDTEDIDEFLDERTRVFLDEHNGMQVDGTRVRLSAIFKWYESDFSLGSYEGPLDFCLKHSKTKLSGVQDSSKLIRGKYLHYDWSPNKCRS
eukprot:Clim_evm37s246 gene=Clim_evmTU37s246